MKNKKLLIGILSACFVTTCAFGVACNNDKGGNGGDSTSESTASLAKITFETPSIGVAKYDKTTLTVEVEGTLERVVWTSSAPSIVSVDENGNIEALAEGEATITASAGGASATCTVIVGAPTTAPVIELGAENVYLNVNGSYWTEVSATWKGEKIEEAITYTWSVADGASEGVVECTPDSSGVTFKGLKEGTTTLCVAATIRGVTRSREITVTVYGTDIVVAAANQALVPQNGYYELNLATANIDEYVNSEALDFIVYENGVQVDAEIVWDTASSDYNANVAVLEGKTLKAKGAGVTTLVGTCTVNGVSTSVTIKVHVEKPRLALSETAKPFLEVENLTEFTLESDIYGEIESVTIHGKEVLGSATGKTILLDKMNMPKEAAKLGEQTMTVSTEYVIYDMPVEIYTMIINDKAEFDAMPAIADANSETVGVWEGWFLLGNDIDYNGNFTPFLSHNHLYALGGDARTNRYNSLLYGWKAIFDGQGYNVDGLAIADNQNSETGIFGVLQNDGIVRNVSFTNATVRENSGYIAASGGGLIENVSVSYKQIGTGVDVTEFNGGADPRILSTFFSTRQGVSSTATVRNCFVDATNATILFDEEKNKGYSWSYVQLAGGNIAVMDGVIVICPNATILEHSGANYNFNDYSEFVSNVDVVDEYNDWDNSFWTNINGIPFTVNQASKIDRDAEIGFVNPPSIAFAGEQTEINTVGAYTNVSFVEKVDGVTYKNGILLADETAIGKKVTLELTSYLNEQVKTIEIDIKQKTDVTITQTEKALLDPTSTVLDISAGNAYNGATAMAYVGTTLVGSGAITDGKLAINVADFGSTYGDLTVRIMTEKDNVYYSYDVEVLFATKIINTVEDFDAVRINTQDKRATSITGYYILGSDIDFKGETISSLSGSPIYSNTVGFRGTFDGNGKTISNFTASANGLFGHIGKGAVIKDVNFDKITYDGKVSAALLAFCINSATLENINVNVAGYGYYNNTDAFSSQEGLLSCRYFQNNTVSNVTVHAEGFDLGCVMARVVSGNTISGMTIYAKSYKYIGDTSDSLKDVDGDGVANEFDHITEWPAGVSFIVA